MNIQFNTNLLETNVINLAVVIGIVISFVGDALKSLLSNRQNLILSNLEEANKRAINAEQKLFEAREKFESAKIKAQEIQNQSINTINKDRIQFKTQTKEAVQRLENLKKETLTFQQKKALTILSKKVIALSLKQVKNKLQSRTDLKFQNSINNFYIALLRNYESFN
uniref:ATP synthase subunit b, chloroplastic n=2 Tax=unclassified Ostreobium TaxID=2086555 RepID=A0A1X9RQ65_9CHLO|nr:ATP synthase CF0 subunit I [Ostreobium sp. HV05042]ARQ82312.1 ATP synthase CF0 subunit I [Ostreobium sp. HV05007a]